MGSCRKSYSTEVPPRAEKYHLTQTYFIMGFESTYQWEDPIYSGVVFGSVFSTLVAICYSSLTLLCAVIGIKIYTYVMVTFLKKETTNPIAKIAGCELTIPADRVNDYASRGTEKVNCAIKELGRLFMVENMLDSIKFGLSLWVLTYIGSWFNAMTLLIMGWVGLFSIPKIYVNNKAQIDPVLDQVKAKLNEVSDKVTALMPQAKAAAVAPEPKKEE